MRTLQPVIALLLLVLLATGCSDPLTSPEMTGSPEAATLSGPSKLRHARMLPIAEKTAGKDGGETGLIVKLHPQRLMERYKIMERYKLVERYKIMERYTYDYVFDGFAITASTESLDDLMTAMSADPDIAWIEPDFTVSGRPFSLGYQTEPDQGELLPWSLERIGAVGREKISEQEDVVLFVVDTGVEHDDLNLEWEFDFGLMEETKGRDSDGHGTHIAGIAAAELNGKGLAGVAPKTQVYSLKVFGNETQAAINSEELDLSTALAAVDYITRFKHENQHIPVVANLAFGSDVGTTDYTSLDEAIAASSSIGVVYVVSAGNDAKDASTYTPAHTREAITVGAYDPASNWASFSNHGPLVDILAPGVDILSLKAGEDDDSPNYALMSGTSMAAAHVSGAAARFLALNPHASPAQVEGALKTSGRAWVSNAPQGTTNLSVYVGEGHLDGASDGDGLMGQRLAPFRDYAIFADGRIKFDGVALISAPGENANLLTNGSIDLKNSQSRVHGFAYYEGGISEDFAASVFSPASNALGLPAYSAIEAAVPVEEFAPEDHLSKATRSFDGSLEVEGTVHLGAGEVWYVDGNLKTTGPTRITGSGILMVKGSADIKHEFITESPVGLYVGSNVKVVTKTGAKVSLKGAIYGDTVQFENDVQIEGQITAINTFELKEDFTLRMTYVRAPDYLTAPIWN